MKTMKGHDENEMTKDHAFDNIKANSEMHFKSSLFRPLSRQFHLNLAQNIFIGTWNFMVFTRKFTKIHMNAFSKGLPSRM